LRNTVRGAWALAAPGKPLAFRKQGDALAVHLPAARLDSADAVIVIELAGKPEVEPPVTAQEEGGAVRLDYRMAVTSGKAVKRFNRAGKFLRRRRAGGRPARQVRRDGAAGKRSGGADDVFRVAGVRAVAMRLDMMRTLNIPSTLVPVLLAASAAVMGADSRRNAVVIVHDEEEPMRALAAGLEKAHAMKPALMDQKDWSGDALNKAHAETGGRLVVLHHGIASAKNANPRWLALAGIRMLPRDDPAHPWKVLRGTYHLVNLNPRHYVTTNRVRYPVEVRYTPSDAPAAEQLLPALEFPDTEIFLNQLITDGREKTILFGFQTEVDGKKYVQDRGGWFKKTGAGHLFYFQPGHFARDFTSAYIQIIANAIEWNAP
jgi:hypothetical protein